jgi:regulation of enolase protein 1 (concanavalin A-like superfamily)
MPKYLGANIEFNDGASVIGCIVRNQSDDGALLKLENAIGIPQEFDLHVTKSDQRFRCQLVWNATSEIGVHFRSDPGARGKHYLRLVR